MNLVEFVQRHSVRGACTCGRCIDAPENPVEQQPNGHTADLVFFKVAAANDPVREDFEALVYPRFPHWLDGKGHNYLEMGGDMGDQGIALQTMGLGTILGTWELLTPHNLGITGDDAMELAGRGMVVVGKGGG